MDLEDAARAGGFRVLHPGIWGDSRSEPMDCNAFRLGGAPPNLEVYVVDGVVDSIRVSMSDEGPWTRIVTENGVGLGDSEAAVRAAYPRVTASASHYLEAPDHDLHEGGGGTLGLRFMIMGGDVVSISAGGQSRDWSDGCG